MLIHVDLCWLLMVDVSVGWAFPACGWAATVHDAPWSFTSSSCFFFGWVYEWNIREHIWTYQKIFDSNKIADTSTSPVDLCFPVLNPFQSLDRTYHHWSRSNWISSSIIIRLAGENQHYLLLGQRLADRKDTDTKSPAGIYCARELVVDPSFWKWLGLHPRWCKRIARVTSIFFYVERPGRALIFDGNPPIPITLYSWWLSYVQSPHYLVGFIGVRLSDSESWTSKCPHEGTLCRPASLYIASCDMSSCRT